MPQRFIFSSCVNLEEPPEKWKEQIEAPQQQVVQGPKENLLDVALNLRPYGPDKIQGNFICDSKGIKEAWFGLRGR